MKNLTVKKSEPKPLPDPPHNLSEAGKDKWREMMPQLAIRRPDFGTFELDLLAQYCRAYAMGEMANLELASYGSLTYQQRGLELERPQLKTIREAGKVMDQVYRRLGFTKKAEYGGEDDGLDIDND